VICKVRWASPICMSMLCAAALTAAASPAPGGDARLGQDKAESERCTECHSNEAVAAASKKGSEGKFPRLAGQAPEYLLKQLRNFRSGERQHDFMAIMARNLDDADAADIAAYFGSLPAMQGDGSGNTPAARELYAQTCMACHGEAGKGQAAAGVKPPVIGGQEWRYLDKQLRDWRSAERRNSADGAMNRVTRSLTDSEIQALADYLAGQ
jgi:cytochrome c553